MAIEPITDGEGGASVRGKINDVITTVNDVATDLPSLSAYVTDLLNQSGIRDRHVIGTRKADEFFGDYGPGNFISWFIGVNPPRLVQTPSAFGWWLKFDQIPTQISHRIVARPLIYGNGAPGVFVRPGELMHDVEVLPTTWYKAVDILKDAEKFDLHQHARFPTTGLGPFRQDQIYWSIITAKNAAGAQIPIGVARGRTKVNDTIDPIWRRGLFSDSISSGAIVPGDNGMVAIALYEAILSGKGGRGADINPQKVALNGPIALNQSTDAPGNSSAWAISLPDASLDFQPAPVGGDSNGSSLAGTDKVSAIGKTRYDLLSVDPKTGSILITKGSERDVEANEYRPTVRGFGILATLRVHNAGVEVIRTCDYDGFVRRGCEGEHATWLEYCRLRLPKTMRAMRRGLPIRYVSYGDSIGAIGGGNGTPYTPNGSNRDILSYLSSYASDALATVPTYTVDGVSGHVRIGSDWYVKDAIEGRWGAPVEYLNMCIAGTKSDNSLTDGIGPNGLYPARMSALLGLEPDLVHIRFGMNEIASSTTFDNLVGIITQLQAAGAEVIVSSCPRPGRAQEAWVSTDWWLYQTKQAIRAAQYCDVAYVDLSRIFGPGNEGAVGISPYTMCDANRYNHPGVYELRKFGEYMSLIFA